MVSQSFQQVDNNCVHGSNTMLSECRFDGVIETMELENLFDQSDCIELVQRRGPPQLLICLSRRRLGTW